MEFVKVGGLQYKINAAKCPECKTEFHKKANSDVVYKGKPGHDFICCKCREGIVVATVAHTIWDGNFPLSGSGRVQNEYVPYYKKCEE